MQASPKQPLNSPADWLEDFRTGNRALFEARGVPTAKLERWKFTNLANRVKNFTLTPGAFDFSPGKMEFVTKLKDALEQSWVREMLEAPAPGEARYKDMALWHLNNAHLSDGLVIDVPAGSTGKSLTLTHTGQSAFTAPRLIIRVGDGAQFTLIETQNTGEKAWKNAVIQIKIGKEAVFRHYSTQNDAEQAVHTQNTHVTIAEGSVYEAFTLNEGAGVTRGQVHAEIAGPNAACNLYALNLLGGAAHGDATWLIEHQAPHCTSDQFVRSLLDGTAHGVFQGKVHVHRIAQKTDGYQLSNTLLLSDNAHMSTKPELEIYADDVKCSHGATTGALNEEPLFYLRSRGLNEAEARFLLASAFVGEVVDRLGDKEFGAMVQEKAERWLRNAL